MLDRQLLVAEGRALRPRRLVVALDHGAAWLSEQPAKPRIRLGLTVSDMMDHLSGRPASFAPRVEQLSRDG